MSDDKTRVMQALKKAAKVLEDEGIKNFVLGVSANNEWVTAFSGAYFQIGGLISTLQMDCTRSYILDQAKKGAN